MSAVDPTPREEAMALVELWSDEMGHPWSGIGLQRITLTTTVKDKMASDIAALINDTVHRERYTAS